MKKLLFLLALLPQLAWAQFPKTIEVTRDTSEAASVRGRMAISTPGLSGWDGTLVGKDFDARSYVASTVRFANRSELRRMGHLRQGFRFMLDEKGKEGEFRYDPDDTTTPDDGGMVIVTTNNKRFKRVLPNQRINVELYKEELDQDYTKAFRRAIAYAKTVNGTITATPGKVYVIDSVVVDGRVDLTAESLGLYRFGGTSGYGEGNVTLKHKAGSTNPMLILRAGGINMRGWLLDGNNAPGTILQVYHGFENRIESVRASFGAGIGIDIQGSCNTYYRDIFVDNCGSETLPGVRIATRQGAGQHTINTIDFYGLTIERCKGVHLEIGRDVNSIVSYPEFVRIHNLHVESPTDNGSSVNYQPLVRFGNCREVTLVAPFIYGGPGPLIEHDQTDPGYVNVLGGIKLLGGTVLGTNVDKIYQGVYTHPKVGIKLTRGNYFNIQGTSLDNLGLQYTPQDTLGSAISIASTYGQDVFLPPTYQLKRASVLVKDNRTNGKPLRYEQEGLYIQDQLFRGHFRSNDQVTSLPATTLANAGSGAPTPIVNGNDQAGIIFFGSGTTPSGGGYVQVTFNKPYKRQPKIALTAGNANVADKALFAATTTTGFGIYMKTSAAASQPVTTYQVQYQIIE